MMDSERVLVRFGERLHGDENSPPGAILMFEQIGVNELQFRTDNGPVVLKAIDNKTIQGPSESFIADGRELTDELYERILASLRRDLLTSDR